MIRELLVLLLVCFILDVSGQNTSCVELSNGKPKPPNITTTVYLSILIVNIAKIDGVEESFLMDFYLSAYWYDPTFDQSDPNFTYRPLIDFNPQVDFQNIVSPPDKLIAEQFCYTTLDEPRSFIKVNDSYLDAKQGRWIQYTQRYSGSFRTRLRLENFPFDYQDATLVIDSSAWTNEQVIFAAASPQTFVSDLSTTNIRLPEWNFQYASYYEKDVFFEAFNSSYSYFVLVLNFHRLPQFYLLKIVSGVILLVFMGIFTLSIVVQEADRMMGTLSLYLGIIQFVFIGSQSLPKVPYNTRIDRFMAFSFITTMLIFVAHAVLYFYRPDEDNDDAEDKKETEMQGQKKGEDDTKKPENTGSVHLTVGAAQNQQSSEGGIFVRFGLPPWSSLTGQRKADLILGVLFSIFYAIGTGSILQS